MQILRLGSLAAASVMLAAPVAHGALRADLKVSRVTAEVGKGRLLVVSAQVRNSGRATAKVSAASVLLSADRRRSGDDASVMTIKIPLLRARRSEFLVGRVVLPSRAPSGVRYVIVCADSKRKVRESRERNNCRTGSALVIPGPAVVPVATPVPTAAPSPVVTPAPTATVTPTPSPSTSPSPDADADGFADAEDNCPAAANADQADADADQKGDVCDVCPSIANPGNQACPPTPAHFIGGVHQCRLQFPAAHTGMTGTTFMVFGRVFKEGVTESPGSSPTVAAFAGIGPDGSDPQASAAWTWTPMAFNPNQQEPSDEDEYLADLTVPAVPEQYDYAVAFTFDEGFSYTACDAGEAGSSNGYAAADAGQLTATG